MGEFDPANGWGVHLANGWGVHLANGWGVPHSLFLEMLGSNQSTSELLTRHNILLIYPIAKLLAKFCKDHKSHTVPARRDCILIVALLWGCVNTPVTGFVV